MQKLGEWQPIETPPENEEPVIFANFDAICLLTCAPHVWSGRFVYIDGKTQMFECSHAAENYNGEPTHWMRLPDNPEGWKKYLGSFAKSEPPK